MCIKLIIRLYHDFLGTKAQVKLILVNQNNKNISRWTRFEKLSLPRSYLF